jgi:hypothetical protein
MLWVASEVAPYSASTAKQIRMDVGEIAELRADVELQGLAPGFLGGGLMPSVCMLMSRLVGSTAPQLSRSEVSTLRLQAAPLPLFTQPSRDEDAALRRPTIRSDCLFFRGRRLWLLAQSRNTSLARSFSKPQRRGAAGSPARNDTTMPVSTARPTASFDARL